MDSINRLQSIWTGLACISSYSAYVDKEDISSFCRRSASEGSEYYARGFTALRSDLLTGLETGVLVVTGRFGLKRNTCLPRFLYRAWCAVFDKETGYLLAAYDTGAVSCLIQLLAVFDKIIGGHTPDSEQRCLDAFVAVEKQLASSSIDPTKLIGKVPLRHILEKASHLIRRVLCGSDPREISPIHGSGASACGTPVRDRYRMPRYVREIDRIWPMTEFYFGNIEHVSAQLPEWLDVVEYEPMAKILLVPKDARGPRIISCEPKETMWIQQGLMTKLYNVIESHPITRGLVNFTNQQLNQRAAYEGSLNRETATLDLKEASDRIRMDLVLALFPPNWGAALQACRSGSTLLPDGRIVEMHKHAPMGSAVCFPVMGLLVWAVLTAALPQDSDVLVYGDDIVIPSESYDLAVSTLEAVHLAVNTSKSYVAGPFRESCGKWYIDGIDVTPVRLRMEPANNSDARARTIAFSNNLFDKFGSQPYWMTTLIHQWYSRVPERDHDPMVGEVVNSYELTTHWDCRFSTHRITDRKLSSVLNVHACDNKHLPSKRCKRTQRRLYRYLMVQPVEVKYSTGDWCHLFRALANPRVRRPLGIDALAKRVSYKYRWSPL